MEQAGEHRIAAPRERVWAALNDPEVLKRCIDGCESLERIDDHSFRAVVRARLGPVNAAFTGEVALKDVDPPNGYTLEVGAKGGPAGFANGTARVRLTDDGADTVLAYTAEGRVGGKLAQIGQRLIDAAARKTADDFFEAFARELAPPADVAMEPGEAAAVGRSGLVWAAVGVLGLAAALVAWFVLRR